MDAALRTSPLRSQPPRSSEHAAALRAVALNIGAAAPARAARIVAWLSRRADDVIVLTETSAGPGTQLLREDLRQRGFQTYSVTDARDRGVLVASRVAVRDVLTDRLRVTLPWRVCALALDTTPAIIVLGVYVPSRDRSAAKIARKQAFIVSLLQGLGALGEPARRNLLLVGDYNAIARRHDPALPGFFSWEYALHDQLEDLGLRPAHELLSVGAQPHSWIGRTGNRYLYDYIHLSPGLQPRLDRCAYLHEPRTTGLSDHAAVTARLRLD
jgi:exodeoxyribonuclease-3